MAVGVGARDGVVADVGVQIERLRVGQVGIGDGFGLLGPTFDRPNTSGTNMGDPPLAATTGTGPSHQITPKSSIRAVSYLLVCRIGVLPLQSRLFLQEADNYAQVDFGRHINGQHPGLHSLVTAAKVAEFR